MKTNGMNRIIVMVALLGGMLAGCQPIEEIDTREIVDENAGKDGYTLTIEAVKSTGTKALALKNDALNTYWTSGEKVGLYVDGVYKCKLTATPKADPKKATLSGTLASLDGITEGKTMTLLYPDRTEHEWDYTGQTGEAPNAGGTGDLSAKYDYATATLTVTGVNGSQVTTSGVATFQNEQSMARFKFNDGLQVKTILIGSKKENLVQSRSWSEGNWRSSFGSLTVTPTGGYNPNTSAEGFYYVSLRNDYAGNDDVLYFNLTVGENYALYSGTQSLTGAMVNGKFYSAIISVSQPDFSPADGMVAFNDVL